MALRRTRLVQSLPSPAAGVSPESQSSMIGHINLGAKQAGKPSAGNPHAGFDVAGTGNRLTVQLVRHSQRKRGATDRLDLRGNRAPVLDPTDERGRKTVGSCMILYRALPRLYRRLLIRRPHHAIAPCE